MALFESLLEASDVPHSRSEISLTIVFPRPSEDTIQLFELPTVDDEAHAIILPQATEETVRDLAARIASDLQTAATC